MKKVSASICIAILLTIFSTSVYAQCWSISAGSSSSAPSNVRPSNTVPYEAILLEMEPLLQKGMGVNSKVYIIEEEDVRADPNAGNIYFGKAYFDLLDQKYKSAIKWAQFDPIPIGIKLILAHEYAHQFQFRMFKKKNVPLTTSTPIDELQADILASYFIGSYLDAQFANLPTPEKIKRVMDLSGGAMMVVSQLGDFYFNDKNHHGNPMTRHDCMHYGFAAGWVNQFGLPTEAMTTREDLIYDWSRKFATESFNNQRNSPNFRGRNF